MPFTVRLSPYLEQKARDRAELLGVSLNSLIAVALDSYLLNVDSESGAAQKILSPAPTLPPPVAPQQPVAECHESPATASPKPAVERPVTTPPPIASTRPVFDPKPELPKNATKRDRQLLSEWYTRNTKKK